LSEVHVSVWPVAAAVYHPYGDWYYKHSFRGYQGLTGQPGLLCFCQCPVKPSKVMRPMHHVLKLPPASNLKRFLFKDVLGSLFFRPAIVVLLMSMVNERQPFVLRCAVLYCFQCFLYKNQKGQGEIVATLLPSTIDANSISAGQLLCGGLFSADSHSNWCAAVALAHALQDNLTQKEQLLRVQLATSLGKPPVSLLQQCTNILSQVENRSGNPDT
ncbi:hypothetical protein XENOCAPTIV_008709, partial [Xenoophorus captivus]